MNRIVKNFSLRITKLLPIASSLGLGLCFLSITNCSTPSAVPSVPAIPTVPNYTSQASKTTARPPSVSNIITAGNRSGDFGISSDAVDSFLSKPKAIVAPSPQIERPGLGTGWGKDINSTVHFTDFKRTNKNPSGVASIYYNDKEGIKAMTNSWTYRGNGLQKAAGGLVEWGVKGSWGYLKNQHSKGKRFVTGNKNKNYTLVVKNLSHTRLEIVLSVDGLDVIDGKPASIKRRGYIIPAGETLTVKGFRKSADAVAAFKFSSVNSSYSQLSGTGTKNVGVIGMAVFTEKGHDPWKYGASELKERNTARPFAEAPQLRAR